MEASLSGRGKKKHLACRGRPVAKAPAAERRAALQNLVSQSDDGIVLSRAVDWVMSTFVTSRPTAEADARAVGNSEGFAIRYGRIYNLLTLRTARVRRMVAALKASPTGWLQEELIDRLTASGHVTSEEAREGVEALVAHPDIEVLYGLILHKERPRFKSGPGLDVETREVAAPPPPPSPPSLSIETPLAKDLASMTSLFQAHGRPGGGDYAWEPEWIREAIERGVGDPRAAIDEGSRQDRWHVGLIRIQGGGTSRRFDVGPARGPPEIDNVDTYVSTRPAARPHRPMAQWPEEESRRMREMFRKVTNNGRDSIVHGRMLKMARDVGISWDKAEHFVIDLGRHGAWSPLKRDDKTFWEMKPQDPSRWVVHADGW
jgi:hypothetical protein